MSVPAPPQSYQQKVLSNIWGFANLIGEKWYHSVISILIALVMSEVERCVIYLRTTSFSFSVDFVSPCFAHFSLGLLVLAQVLSISLLWPFQCLLPAQAGTKTAAADADMEMPTN